MNINVDYIRAICYDEAVYPDPHIYDPTRFLDKDGRIDPSVKAPEARVFGSGRRYEYVMIALITFLTVFNRICPGRHFALRMLHFTIARILATFDILPPVGDDGRPMIPEAKYGKSILRSVHNSGCGTGLIQSPALEIRCHLNAW